MNLCRLQNVGFSEWVIGNSDSFWKRQIKKSLQNILSFRKQKYNQNMYLLNSNNSLFALFVFKLFVYVFSDLNQLSKLIHPFSRSEKVSEPQPKNSTIKVISVENLLCSCPLFSNGLVYDQFSPLFGKPNQFKRC